MKDVKSEVLVESFVLLYSVYDKVAKKFGPIFQCVNEAVAVRRYKQLLKTVDDLSMSDFELVYVGRFDEFTGYIDVGFAVLADNDKIIEEIKQ